jgi:catechol 2,3-dioxygenase-like lactoylglutathione lyase family enzyme
MTPITTNRVAHCNVNCSDLTRSLDFYQLVVGLEPLTRTAPPPQSGGGFALASDVIQWDAYMLHDSRGAGGSPALDLLEWQQPAPVGSPYASVSNVGLAKLRYEAPSLPTIRGLIGVSSTSVTEHRGEATYEVVLARDPDGTQLEFVEGPAVRSSRVRVGCTDLDRSTAWYIGNLGLEPIGPVQQWSRSDGTSGRSVVLVVPGQREYFGVELVQWSEPASGGVAYGTANNLGIYRLAFMVSDIHADYEQLVANGVVCTGPPVQLDMGPTIPIEGLWALFFVDPDGACVELIEEPRPLVAG